MQALKVIMINMRREPDQWHIDDFWVTHRSGLKIWIGNGLLGCRIEKPEYRELSLSNRFKLYRAIKQLKETKKDLL